MMLIDRLLITLAFFNYGRFLRREIGERDIIDPAFQAGLLWRGLLEFFDSSVFLVLLLIGAIVLVIEILMDMIADTLMLIPGSRPQRSV